MKPPCDDCSTYDFSCTGACEKPIMADNINYNPPHPGVTVANTVIYNANTIYAVPTWPMPMSVQQWNWPVTAFVSAHPVLGFVTSSPHAVSFRVCEEAPRSRTVIFQGRPLRLYWPRLAFFDGGRGFHSSANLFVFRVDGDSPLTASTPLRQFPFTLWHDSAKGRVASYSHVSQIGHVCFNAEAMSIIRDDDRDPVDVFWSSGFGKIDAAVLTRWQETSDIIRQRDRQDDDAWRSVSDEKRAQVLAPGFFPDADWTWNKLASGGLTVGSMLAGTKHPALVMPPAMPALATVDSREWTG